MEELTKQMENRHYQSTKLPTFQEEANSEHQFEIAKEIYSDEHTKIDTILPL